MKIRISKQQVGGFTVLELLVVLGFAGILLAFSAPSMLQAVRRAKSMGVAQSTTQLLQVARLNSIKHFRRAIVHIDPPGVEPEAPVDNPVPILKAFIDRNGNAAPDGRELLGVVELPNGLEVSVDGFSPDPRDPDLPNTAVFNPDGTMLDTGAFRFTDERENELETRVLSRTDFRVRIQKKDKDTNQWLDQGEGATPWEWY